MIYWPLMTLSRLFSSQNVLVSTDSDKIKSLVEAKGLTVPFKRTKDFLTISPALAKLPHTHFVGLRKMLEEWIMC